MVKIKKSLALKALASQVRDKELEGYTYESLIEWLQREHGLSFTVNTFKLYKSRYLSKDNSENPDTSIKAIEKAPSSAIIETDEAVSPEPSSEAAEDDPSSSKHISPRKAREKRVKELLEAAGDPVYSNPLIKLGK